MKMNAVNYEEGLETLTPQEVQEEELMNFDEYFYEQLERNKLDLRRMLRMGSFSKEYRTKICSHAEMHQKSQNEVINALSTQSEFFNSFVISPVRQNIGENYHKLEIDELIRSGTTRLLSCTKLPDKGDAAYYFVNGRLVRSTRTMRRLCRENSEHVLTSVDFKETFSDVVTGSIITLWGSHKRQTGDGGSQDQSFANLCAFAKHTRQTKEKCIAIPDGDYYTDERIRQLRSLNPDLLVLRTSEYARYFSK